MLREKVDVIEERVDGLEAILGQFMAQTGAAMIRLDRTVERLDRTVEWMAEARKEDRREWNKRWGELANRLGTFVEDIVAPNIPRLARDYFDCDDPLDFMVRRKIRSKRDRAKRREFDVIAVYDDTVVINETKATPRIDGIDDFITALEELGDYLPEYQGKTVIPVFASLYMGEDVVNYLTKHGIYAMAMGEETMDLLNFEQVGPLAQE